jgi:hypothetical protein
MINSRFSATGRNTYEIIDRKGNNDTNIYDKESFDTDVSLYKKATTIAKIKRTYHTNCWQVCGRTRHTGYCSAEAV